MEEVKNGPKNKQVYILFKENLECEENKIEVGYLGEGCGLLWTDWYCKVASSIDSAKTALFSISASVADASSYFSCIKHDDYARELPKEGFHLHADKID